MKRIVLLKSITLTTMLIALTTQSVRAGSFDDGIKMLSARDYQRALNLFQTPQSKQAQPALSLYYQGLCHQYLRQFDQSKICYNQVLSGHPGTDAALKSRTALTAMSATSTTAAGASNPSINSAVATPAAVRKITTGERGWYMDNESVLGEVPFALRREGMIVNVTIQGKQVPAIFDTGANITLFDQSVLTGRGVNVKGAKRGGVVHGVAGQSACSLLTSDVSLGTLSEKIDVFIVDDTTATRNGETNHYGLVGADFFGKYVFEVDPQASVIRFLKKVPPRKKEISTRNNPYAAYGEPFEWDGASIIVTAKANGRECKMVLDTGATGVAFSDNQLSAAGLSRPVNADQGYSSGIGGHREAYIFQIDSLGLGPAVKRYVAASCGIHGTQSHPLLGMSFLGDIRFIVDPEKQIIRLAKPQ